MCPFLPCLAKQISPMHLVFRLLILKPVGRTHRDGGGVYASNELSTDQLGTFTLLSLQIVGEILLFPLSVP